MASDPLEKRLLAIVNDLPGAYEDRPWGSVHCKVAGKIFVGWGRGEDGEMSIGFKTDKSLQAMLVASDPRFTVAKYVGKHGWVDMGIGDAPNWDEVEQFVVDSYRRIAPKKLVKELDGRTARGAGQRVARAGAGALRNQSSETKSATSRKATMAMAKSSESRAGEAAHPRLRKQSKGRTSTGASSKKRA